MKIKKTIALMLIIGVLFSSPSFASDIDSVDEIYCKTKVLSTDEIQSCEKIVRSTREIQNEFPELNLVKAVQKEVYLSEVYDDLGNIIDSHFMTNEEVQNFKNGIMPMANLGDQTEVAGKLTFTATLYDDASNNYYAYAIADWENGSWITTNGYDFPAKGQDSIAIAWGGTSAFKNVDYRSSGEYQFIGDDIVFHESPNNPYRGICWNFNETKEADTHIYFADTIYTSVKISPVNTTLQGKTTNIQFVYFHTYENENLTVDFTTSNEKVFVNGSGMSSVRSVAIDFPELQY